MTEEITIETANNETYTIPKEVWQLFSKDADLYAVKLEYNQQNHQITMQPILKQNRRKHKKPYKSFIIKLQASKNINKHQKPKTWKTPTPYKKTDENLHRKPKNKQKHHKTPF